MKKPEPDYAWKLKDTKKTDAGTVYELHLVSQKWQGLVWEHGLVVYHPKDARPAATTVSAASDSAPMGCQILCSKNSAIGLPIARCRTRPRTSASMLA